MANRTLFDVFEDDVRDEAYEIGDEIEEALADVNADFFKLLVQKAFGKPNMPDFVTASNMDGTTGLLPWADLSTKYLAWKEKHGKGSNFYSKDKKLSKFLFNLDPDTMLGVPEVTIVGAQDYVAAQPAKAGVKVKVRNKTSPGFAPVDEVRVIPGRPAVPAQAARPASIEISVMPLMDGYANIEEAMFGRTSTIMPNAQAMYKLTGPRGTHLRPLLTPYLNWFYKTRCQVAIDRVLEEYS